MWVQTWNRKTKYFNAKARLEGFRRLVSYGKYQVIMETERAIPVYRYCTVKEITFPVNKLTNTISGNEQEIDKHAGSGPAEEYLGIEEENDQIISVYLPDISAEENTKKMFWLKALPKERLGTYKTSR